MNFFTLAPIGDFSPVLQVAVVVALFFIAAFQQYNEAKRAGKMYGTYPPSIFLILVPIYEEILFRGLLLGGLLIVLPAPHSVVISSVLFGLWHIKNMRWDGKKRVTYNILYTGIILGPILAGVTLLTGSILFAIILHYINNIWAPISQKILRRF